MIDALPKILIISLVAGLLTQGLKIIFKSIRTGKFRISYIDDYGGMPSSHSAFTVSLLTAIGLEEGIATTAFAIAFIVSMLLMRDAVGIRMELEKQGKLLKKVAEKQNQNQTAKTPIDGNLGDRIGHTYPEIVAGGFIGFTLALILHFII